MRWASMTWWRISRAQAWLRALMEANMVATQITPPEISCEKAPRGIEGEGEKHHHQQRKEQHGVDGVARAPLDAQIFDEMCPEGRVMLSVPPEELALKCLVRSAVCASAARM
jgi:hypothetical protein